MAERALMALYDARHRLELPGGYWLQKDDDSTCQVGQGGMFLGFQITGNVPVGRGGSIDDEIRLFAEAMSS